MKHSTQFDSRAALDSKIFIRFLELPMTLARRIPKLG
jgi:hypothetical protein